MSSHKPVKVITPKDVLDSYVAAYESAKIAWREMKKFSKSDAPPTGEEADQYDLLYQQYRAATQEADSLREAAMAAYMSLCEIKAEPLEPDNPNPLYCKVTVTAPPVAKTHIGVETYATGSERMQSSKIRPEGVDSFVIDISHDPVITVIITTGEIGFSRQFYFPIEMYPLKKSYKLMVTVTPNPEDEGKTKILEVNAPPGAKVILTRARPGDIVSATLPAQPDGKFTLKVSPAGADLYAVIASATAPGYQLADSDMVVYGRHGVITEPRKIWLFERMFDGYQPYR